MSRWVHSMRFAFFVDGSNLLGSLKRLGVHVDDYALFYQFLFKQCVESWKYIYLDASEARARISRIYWYEVGSMDEWDLTSSDAEQSLKESFGRHADLKRSFMALAGQQNQGLSQSQLHEKAWESCFGQIRDWYQAKQNSLDGIKRFHYAVQSQTDFIDIIECGHWKVDMLNRKVEEKGLDTSLAVDMVTQVPHYDVAILVSGDADAIPSLNFVKREGKHVGVIEFIKGYPPESRGRQSSSRLKVAADFVPQIYESDLVQQNIARVS